MPPFRSAARQLRSAAFDHHGDTSTSQSSVNVVYPASVTNDGNSRVECQVHARRRSSFVGSFVNHPLAVRSPVGRVRSFNDVAASFDARAAVSAFMPRKKLCRSLAITIPAAHPPAHPLLHGPDVLRGCCIHVRLAIGVQRETRWRRPYVRRAAVPSPHPWRW